MTYISPPQTEAQLMQRAQAIAGRTFSSLADELGWQTPPNLKKDKGWVGQLIEAHLGADAKNLSEPDFSRLGVELKTLPINTDLRVRETTYVCTVPLIGASGMKWHESCVYRKLKRVLFQPIEGDVSIPLGQRRAGIPFLWSPTEQQEIRLRQDWEELMEIISHGGIDSITAHMGEILQIRPKAANSKARTTGVGLDGNQKDTLPRGFYLRTAFTNEILQNIMQAR